MTTLLVTHPACLDHDPGAMHPETPSRLRAVLKVLDDPVFTGLMRREAPAASVEQIARVHGEAYIRALLEVVPASGHVGLDPDTVISPGSGGAALRAVGALVAAVDAVMA